MNKRYEKDTITNFDLEYLIKQINDIFYDKVYDDKWLFDIFGLVDIDHIKSQQTEFILGALGGPKRYGDALLRMLTLIYLFKRICGSYEKSI